MGRDMFSVVDVSEQIIDGNEFPLTHNAPENGTISVQRMMICEMFIKPLNPANSRWTISFRFS